MAGQPQEPSWQPSAPDQGHAAWQQPGYSPSAGGPHDSTYAYGQQPGMAGQPGPGYPPPGYGPQDPSQDPAQWQAISGMTAAGQPRPGKSKAKAPGEKGFVGSLFDFSFTSMVTPKVIKALYALFSLWTALWALILIVQGFHYGHFVGGVFVLVIVVPIFVLVTLGVFRVVLEAFMVLHRIHQDIRAMRANTEQ